MFFGDYTYLLLIPAFVFALYARQRVKSTYANFSRRGPSILMDIGILLFAGAVAFTVITLPVEFNASKRALALLQDRGFLNSQELVGAKKVLSAAALTYVAATAMAAIQLLRMFLLRQSRD